MVPFVLPPVGTCGRPLRDLLLSPALGASQLWGLGVGLKGRLGVVENWRWVLEGADVEGVRESALRAVQMPEVCQWRAMV